MSAEIQTLEGVMRANNGDWIIRGVQGEIYPCKPDIFTLTYQPADPVCCMDCGCDYDAAMACDLVIPRDQWLKVNPADGGALCANCLLRRAAALPNTVNITGRITTGDDSLETYRAVSDLARDVRGEAEDTTALKPPAKGDAE